MSARSGGSFGGRAKPLRMRAPPPVPPPPSPKIQGAVKGVIDYVLRDARCLACDRRPEEVWQDTDEGRQQWRVVFLCHGNHHVVTVDFDGAKHPWRDEWIGRLIDEVQGLFPHDAHPDMKELLRYNREAR